MADTNEQGKGQGTPSGDETQTASANIRISANSNEQPEGEQPQQTAPVKPEGEQPQQTAAVKWEGDPRYFQTGDKAGTLKPRYRQVGGAKPREAGGLDAENAGKQRAGLRVDELRASAPDAGKPQKSQNITKEEVKKLKEEKRKLSADFTARVVMRVLDAAVNIISKGQYGERFTEEQSRKRLTYREMLQTEWKEYLLTLDVDLAPWAMVAVGSLEYVGEAFNTPAGKERVKTLREKVFGGIVNATLGRLFK